MVVDLGVGLEGTTEDELPEAILGQARFDRVDLDSAVPLLAASVGSSGATSVAQGSTSSGNSSIFSFGWGNSASTEAPPQIVAPASGAVMMEGAQVSAPFASDMFKETPAQKLRHALAVDRSASSTITSVTLTVEK